MLVKVSRDVLKKRWQRFGILPVYNTVIVTYCSLIVPWFEYNIAIILIKVRIVLLGKLPGLVVNVEDSQSEPWSLDVSSIPGFALKLDG